MEEKMELYNKYRHRLAFKQLIERFCFEIEAMEKIFDDDEITLEKLKKDTHSLEVFDDTEFEEAFEKCQQLKNNFKFIDEKTV